MSSEISLHSEHSKNAPRVVTQGLIPYLIECVCGRWTAQGIALGLALGVILGLLPKGNFTALAFFWAIYFSSANTLAGIFAAALCTPLAIFTCNFAVLLGEPILKSSVGEFLIAWRETVPLFAWSDLDTPLVLGQLVIGILIAIVVFVATVFIIPASPAE